jgi:hypothetical protein
MSWLRHRWGRRVLDAAAAYVGFEVLLTLIDADPDPVRLALLVATCAALLGLVADALGADPRDGAEPPWRIELERPSLRASGDPRLLRHVALVEAQLAARTPDRALRDRLGGLADQVLQQRHGLRVDDPRAPERLGAELHGVLSGPPRRLDLTVIDRCLTAIEEL